MKLVNWEAENEFLCALDIHEGRCIVNDRLSWSRGVYVILLEEAAIAVFRCLLQPSIVRSPLTTVSALNRLGVSDRGLWL